MFAPPPKSAPAPAVYVYNCLITPTFSEETDRIENHPTFYESGKEEQKRKEGN